MKSGGKAMKTPQEKLKLIETALERLLRDDAAEGINFTVEEREVVIAALEIGHEIVERLLGATGRYP